MTKYYDAPGVRGCFENISLDHIYASFSKGTVDVPGNYGPLIHIGHGVDIHRLTIRNLIREETVCPTPTMEIEENARIDSLCVYNLHNVNRTSAPIDAIVNHGRIQHLSLVNCRCQGGSLLVEKGVIEEKCIS